MSEFSLIERYFNWHQPSELINTGIGDDAAVVDVPTGEQLVISVDTSVCGVHFPESTPAHAIGHKSLAVNLSDLAAMGATPRWFTLALTLPERQDDWLQSFSSGLRTLAERHNIQLIGGDTTRGPLSISIQVIGSLPRGSALLRSGAKAGDLIVVSGTLGDAAAGLQNLWGKLELPIEDADYCQQRLNYPAPRLELGKLLRQHGYASSCMDLSDGLLGDLKHICKASQLGATINPRQLPFSSALAGLPEDKKIPLALTGGDDYELLFTLAPEKLSKMAKDAEALGITVTVIGEMTDNGTEIYLSEGVVITQTAFDHFA